MDENELVGHGAAALAAHDQGKAAALEALKKADSSFVLVVHRKEEDDFAVYPCVMLNTVTLEEAMIHFARLMGVLAETAHTLKDMALRTQQDAIDIGGSGGS
jgi:hypothetical protein